MAKDFPISKTIFSSSEEKARAAPINAMIIGWIAQSPTKVMPKNIGSWVLLADLSLKVNFLLAKKLNAKAIDVEMMFANNIGVANRLVNAKSIVKSITVLVPPTATNRILSELFFINFCRSCNMLFPDVIKWSMFGFDEYLTDIFTNDT